MKSTLFYWMFRQAFFKFAGPLSLVGLFIFGYSAFAEGLWGSMIGFDFILIVWVVLVVGEHREREEMRQYILGHVLDAEKQWKENGRPWMRNGHPYWQVREDALAEAFKRPDLYREEYELVTMCRGTPYAFATGCKTWPEWRWDPIAQ